MRRFTLIRMAYERSEPVPNSLGESDVQDRLPVWWIMWVKYNHEDGWSGFHRVRRILWENNTTDGTIDKYADQLVNDIPQELKAKIATVEVTPDIMLTGLSIYSMEVATQRLQVKSLLSLQIFTTSVPILKGLKSLLSL